MKEMVAVTGMGLVSSLGNSGMETWEALLSLQCGIRSLQHTENNETFPGSAAQVTGLGPDELDIHPRDSRIMYRHSYMLMKGTRDAFQSAMLGRAPVLPEEIAYYAGMGMVDYSIDDLLPSVLQSLDEQGRIDYDRFYSDAYRQIHPLWPLSMLNNIHFCQVAIDLNLKGENTTFCPHGDSGIHAVIEGYHAVQEDGTRVALAGGVSETVSLMATARAEWFNIVNSRDGKCSPFGLKRSGTVLGEGCGIVSLETIASAQERGVPCLAAVTGYGTSFGRSADTYAATAQAISLSMENALAMAEITPSGIDLIIAHGDGTAEGDAMEMEAIHTTFASSLEKVRAYSSKGALGHLLAGAPVVDLILGIYMLRHGIIPATYCSPPFDTNLKFAVVHNEPLRTAPERILINSRSYEGQCASIIIEAVRDERRHYA